MAAPTFVDAATAAIDITGPWSYTCQAPAAAGNLIVVHLLQDGVTAGAVVQTTATNINNLAGTANAWSRVAIEQPVGTTGLHSLFMGMSTGTSAPTIVGTNSGTEDVATRSYQFTNVTSATTPFENGGLGTLTNGSGTSTSVLDTAVTTLDVDRLACNFIAVAVANRASELTAMSGMTGGTWAYAVAAAGAATGLGYTLALTTAAMATPGTIDGGSDAITSSDWGNIGLALIGTTGGTSAPMSYITG